MTEEEYFRKNYPDSCYGDKPLSPHWDFFQDGVEFGERQSEKQIQIDAEQIRALQKQNGELTDKVKELEAQIEKLIDFVLSKTECCDVCPITDTCINSEGTCPYAGILSKGEEAVTREWLMQKIEKEIKEK